MLHFQTRLVSVISRRPRAKVSTGSGLWSPVFGTGIGIGIRNGIGSGSGPGLSMGAQPHAYLISY